MDHGYLKLGELLLAQGIINAAQLATALETQVQTGKRLGDIFLEQGTIDEEGLALCLAKQYGYEIVDLNAVVPGANALHLLQPDEALNLQVLPISADETELFCVVCDPLNLSATDELRMRFRLNIRIGVAPEKKLLAAIRRSYYGSAEGDEAPAQLPSRFSHVEARGVVAGLSLMEATDTNLDRRITVVVAPREDSSQDAHLELVKRAAKLELVEVATVHESSVHGFSRWTILECLGGEQLGSVLKYRGKRSVKKSAEIARVVAQAAVHIPVGSTPWICPENVWLEKGQVKVVPVFPAPEKYRLSSDVEAIGALLWHCLTGSFNGVEEYLRSPNIAVPSALEAILKQCLDRRSPEWFSSCEEVANALASYNWSSAETLSVKASQEERQEILSGLSMQSANQRPSVWRRLFWKRAA